MAANFLRGIRRLHFKAPAHFWKPFMAHVWDVKVPDMGKRFLKNIRLEKSGADKKRLREGLLGLWLEVGPPQKEELLPRQETVPCKMKWQFFW